MTTRQRPNRRDRAASPGIAARPGDDTTKLPTYAEGDLSQSNLSDLAVQINAEHESASLTLKQGMQHAVSAGRALIAAKKLVAHGGWLAWLKANCTASPRTLQAYMKVAGAFDALGNEEANTQRVADLSFRGALESLAVAGSVVVEEHAEAWTDAVRHAKMLDQRASFTMETPPGMLPSKKATRKIRTARHVEDQQWMLAIGPDISRADLMEREAAARATAPVQQLQQTHDDLLTRAAALEAEAKAVREQARDVDKQITATVMNITGPVHPFTETYTFQSDKATDRELVALPQDELVARLMATREKAIEYGIWGDMRLLGHIDPCRGGVGGGGWTKIGSPEWLDGLFPNWTEPSKEQVDSKPTRKSRRERSAKK
jgi:hypothetical protein